MDKREVAECAGLLVKLCGTVAGAKFIDWSEDPDLYFERVESGYYDDLERSEQSIKV